MSPRRVLRNWLISRSRRPYRVRPSADPVYRGRVLAFRSLSPPFSSSRSRPWRPPPRGRRRRLSACSGQDRVRLRHARRAARSHGHGARHRPRCITPSSARARRRLLIALSGGPGQSAVSSASSFAISLDPALRRYRLVGARSARDWASRVSLSCPNPAAAAFAGRLTPPRLSSTAPNRIGPSRAFYTTADTVLDIDAPAPGAGRPTRSH